MAFATLHFEHPVMLGRRDAPVGFSWTSFFFGPFPALFRGHWAGAAILLLAALVTADLSNLVFMFIYNKMFIRHLVQEGWRVTDATDDLQAIEVRIGMRLPRARTQDAET
jgi:hypothetical protein